MRTPSLDTVYVMSIPVDTKSYHHTRDGLWAVVWEREMVIILYGLCCTGGKVWRLLSSQICHDESDMFLTKEIATQKLMD